MFLKNPLFSRLLLRYEEWVRTLTSNLSKKGTMRTKENNAETSCLYKYIVPLCLRISQHELREGSLEHISFQLIP